MYVENFICVRVYFQKYHTKKNLQHELFKVCIMQVEGNLMSMSSLTKMFKLIINYIKGKLIFDSIIQLVYIALGNFYLLHIFYPFVGVFDH